MFLNIEVSGIDAFSAKIEALSKTGIRNALTKGALIVEKDAKNFCPVDTGELRASITHEIDNDEAIIGTNLEYAPYVEIGTGIYSSEGDGRQTPWCYQDAEGNWHYTNGQLPQPYLKPALDKNKSKILSYIKDELEKK